MGLEEGCKHQGLHSHELDEDVEGGAGGVLERVSHSVTDDGSLVGVGSLASQGARVLRGLSLRTVTYIQSAVRCKLAAMRGKAAWRSPRSLSEIAALQSLLSGCLSRLQDPLPKQHPLQLRGLGARTSWRPCSLQPHHHSIKALKSNNLYPVA